MPLAQTDQKYAVYFTLSANNIPPHIKKPLLFKMFTNRSVSDV